MDKDNSLTSHPSESPSEGVESYADLGSNPAERLANAFLDDDTYGNLPSDDTSVEEATAAAAEESWQDEDTSDQDGSVEESEEVVEEVEETSEDSPQEDSEEVNEETDDQEGPTDDEEIYFEYEELKGDNKKFPIKRNGKIDWMTFDEIQNDVARIASAREGVEEAKVLNEQAQERNRLNDEREQRLVDREQLLGGSSQLQALEALYQDAVQKGHSDRAKEIAEHYGSLEVQVKDAYNRYQSENINTQVDILNNSGYGHLVSDEKAQNRLKEFSNDMSKDTQRHLNENAELLMLAEDARKWRESQLKAKKTSKLKGTKTVQTTKKAPVKQETKDIQAQRKRIRDGKATADDMNAVADRIVDAFFDD